jgi:hypothetical protein
MKDRKVRAREIRQQFILEVHEALKQAFTVAGFVPENTVVTILHKDSLVCPPPAKEFCEKSGQTHAVMCGMREIVASEILKPRNKNGKQLFERTARILSEKPKQGYVYVVAFEEDWASVSPILWTEEPPRADASASV